MKTETAEKLPTTNYQLPTENEKHSAVIGRGIAMPAHQVRAAINQAVARGQVSEEDGEEVYWLYSYAQAHQLREADLAAKMKAYDKNTLYQLFRGMYGVGKDGKYASWGNVVKAIKDGGITRGIVVDDYAVAPFMIASKNHGIVCAPTYEDYTSSMTRHHNSTQIIALAANITAPVLSCQLAENFCKTEYDGGRHQVRIDMMNRIL